MSRVIGVLSGKGGVGKTTLVANLGASLTNDFKKNVIIVDSNITTSHLGMHLGLYEDLPVTLREVLNKGSSVNYAVYIHPQTGIRLLPAPLSGRDIQFEYERFRNVIIALQKNYDIILVDIAPGLGREAIIATGAVGEGIIITTPDLPAVTDALKTIDLLKRLKKTVLGVVVNRKKGEKYELSIEEIASHTEVPLLSVIPEDKKIPISISKGTPVVMMDGNSSAALAIKILAGKLINEKYQPAGFVYSLKKMLGLIKDYSEYQNQNKSSFETHERQDIEKLKEEILMEVRNEMKTAAVQKRKRSKKKISTYKTVDELTEDLDKN